MSSLIGLPGTFEFQIGFLIGLAGLTFTILFRGSRVDWGVVWSVCGLVALVRTNTFAEGRPGLNFEFEPWLLLVALGLASVAAPGLARGRAQPWLAIGFLASVLGVWATVPDTEAISVLVGVTVAMIWSWWPLRFAFPGVIGSSAVVVVATVATIIGGVGRERAMVGGFGIVAVLGTLGLLERWIGRSSAPLDLGLHVLLVAIWLTSSRLQSEPLPVLASGTVASGVLLSSAWVAAHKARPSPNQVEDSTDDPLPPGHVE